MATKNKKNTKKVDETVDAPAQLDAPKLPHNKDEGDVDPYASGFPLANAEPNNGQDKSTPAEFDKAVNGKTSKEDDVSEDREEKVAVEK